MVRPLTEPHGWNTVSGVTTPSGLCGTAVVVVSRGCVGAGVSPLSRVVFDKRGGSVVTDPSGPIEITFSPLATQALATTDTASTKGISFFTAAILGIGSG
jgi:hypothetical protein